MNKNELEFNNLYKSYRPRILRYLTRLVGEDEAEDLTQEVFIKINNSLMNFKGKSKLSTWIYRIATNVAIDKMRSPAFKFNYKKVTPNAQMINSVEEEEDKEFWTGQIPPSIEEVLVKREMRECFLEFVKKLDLNYRAVFILSDLIGMPNKKISEILCISLPTVKIRLHRSRLKLKEQLETNCGLVRGVRKEILWEGKRP